MHPDELSNDAWRGKMLAQEAKLSPKALHQSRTYRRYEWTFWALAGCCAGILALLDLLQAEHIGWLFGMALFFLVECAGLAIFYSGKGARIRKYTHFRSPTGARHIGEVAVGYGKYFIRIGKAIIIFGIAFPIATFLTVIIVELLKTS